MRVAIAALLLVASSAAFADDFPMIDVEANCTRTMKRQPFIGECIRREQPAYDLARQLWPELTAEGRGKARTWEHQPGSLGEANPAYYQNLVQAILIERRREQIAAPPPRFRY
jgi:hypothetical protein